MVPSESSVSIILPCCFAFLIFSFQVFIFSLPLCREEKRCIEIQQNISFPGFYCSKEKYKCLVDYKAFWAARMRFWTCLWTLKWFLFKLHLRSLQELTFYWLLEEHLSSLRLSVVLYCVSTEVIYFLTESLYRWTGSCLTRW